MKRLFRLGLIINPIAGMGGKVGLHGTDGSLLERARELGAIPISHERTRRALGHLQDIVGEFEIFAADGEMGYAVANELGFSVSRVEVRHPLRGNSRQFCATFAVDTRESAKVLLNIGVDLILFAGGDGTARDIHSVVGDSIPLLGIPTGVKMRSGVFATNPESAGDLARAFILKRETFPTRDVEILDHSEISGDEEWPSTVFFGQARAPYSQRLLQSPKSTSFAHGEVGITSLCKSLADNLHEGVLYFYGPGTTTKKILAGVGEKGTPMGVDASLGKRIIGRDLSEVQILALLAEFKTATLFLGVIGGQGFLLGRGNQQISGEVINRLKVQNIVLLASAEKIANLNPSVLQVDVGDPVAESALEGYRKVHVAPGRSVMCRVITPQRIEGNRVAV